MRWLGTAVGGAVGLFVGGPVGALFGALLGQGIDRGLVGGPLGPGLTPERRIQIQEQFFETTFAAMGQVAKADGRVNEAEIAFAESVMDRMALTSELRRAAIALFNQGKSSEFALVPALDRFKAVCAGQGPLLRLFLEVQIAIAHVDRPPVAAQRTILEEIRRRLEVSNGDYRRLERLVALQQRVQAAARSAGRSRRPSSSLAAGGSGSGLVGAYATLGVQPKASDAEIKRAYRRLLSQHHPDKLVSRGLPEEALRLASQKTQEIRRAYEVISRARSA